ncbi:MAG: hypothetical protein H7338_14220 [Candidatus Sericytochromatia bacterium]|nr:hypothetical protein [Candidatus Sericytochromatia bacterium]
MATALLDKPQWHAEMPPLPGTRRRSAPTAAVRPMPAPLLFPALPVAPPQPSIPASRITRALFSAFMALGIGTMGLYIHTLRIEGDANHQQHEIRQLKEGNHYLQVQLAQTTNLDRVENQATSKLKMVPRDESVFMALPKEVSDLARTRIIPGREPTPTPVWPGF